MTAHAIHAPAGATVAVPRTTKPQVSPPQRRPNEPPQQSDDTDEATTSASTDEDEDEPAQFAHWRAHSDHHFALRKAMIARLQRLHPLLATDATMQYAGQFTRIPELVQRLELMLYKAAASLDEYTNLCTLERRVHSLVTLLEPLPAPTALLKRPAAPASSGVATSKRRRRAISWSVSSSSLPSSAAPAISLKALSTPPSRLTSELSADLLAHVFGFVDGVDTLRHVARVNRFFRREAPRLVQTLRLDVGDVTHARALQGRVREALAACANVTTLVVTNSRNDGAKKNGLNTMRACHGNDLSSETMGDVVRSHSAQSSAAAPAQFTGRELLHELSALWLGSPRRVVFPKLRRLELRAPFDCANEADATLACVHALASNLSRHKTPVFETLVLDTTLLGDRRVARLAALFRAFPSVFAHRLRALELRNNFVGEAGMAALCRALAGRDASSTWKQLERLALARNIATDGDAHALARCLDALPRLRQLDVSENFIGKPGFEALASRLRGETRCVAVVTGHNCMESIEAANLFM